MGCCYSSSELAEREYSVIVEQRNTSSWQSSGKDEDLLKQYYCVVHLGEKLYSEGHRKLTEAIEKQTEAIRLARLIPLVQGDLIPLYDNRSAMYEKLGLFKNSMQDINMVLERNPEYSSARQRRVRILERFSKTQNTSESGMKSDLNSTSVVDDGDWIGKHFFSLCNWIYIGR